MKISFTTLSCPEWGWEKILAEAAQLGFDGIELRGIEGEMLLHKARPFLEGNIDRAIAQLAEKNLAVCCLGTSCRFHDEQAFAASIEEGKASIDLAVKLGAPYIRVFGDIIPADHTQDDIVKMVAEGLETLGRYAEDKGVFVLLETHGDFCNVNIVNSVLSQVECPQVGILWDVEHPFKTGKEPVDTTWTALKNHIRHMHIKDAKISGVQAKLCLIGEGDVPLGRIVELLKEDGYDGWLSLEWEKKWVPELEEPEVAIPAYIRYMKDLLG